MNSQPLSAVLFDLDGTLVDSVIGVTKSISHALHEMGWPAEDPATLLRHVGPPLEDGFASISGMTVEQADRATRLFRDRYVPVGAFEAEVFPGMLDLVRELSDVGVPLAVATSKEESVAGMVVRHFGFEPFFAAITGATVDTSRRSKSSVVAEALRRLHDAGHDVTHPVLIGDRHHDVDGARTNGIRCVGVQWGYAEPGELHQADAVVEHVSALRSLLLPAGR